MQIGVKLVTFGIQGGSQVRTMSELLMLMISGVQYMMPNKVCLNAERHIYHS